jgi:hypothetical protein
LLKYNGPDSLEYDPVREKYVAQKAEYYVKDVGLNIEQDNYMWYLRDYLVLPDVRLAHIQQGAEKSASARDKTTRKKEKKGLKGFFKNLFKKKPKAVDSTQVVPPKEEFDFIDADTISQAPPPETRKGFFASRKRKSSDQSKPSVVPPGNRKPGTGDALKEDEPAPEEKPAPAEGF